MCNKEEETLEHLMLQCPCFRGAREKIPIDAAELIDKAGGNKILQTATHLQYWEYTEKQCHAIELQLTTGVTSNMRNTGMKEIPTVQIMKK